MHDLINSVSQRAGMGVFHRNNFVFWGGAFENDHIYPVIKQANLLINRKMSDSRRKKGFLFAETIFV